MNDKFEFSIFLRKKNPVLTSILGAVIAIFILVLTVLWVFYAPSTSSRSPLEMKTAWFILAVPDWVKYLSFVGILGLTILVPFYLLRKQIDANLIFDHNKIFIKEKSSSIEINDQLVKNITLNDLRKSSGSLKNKLQLAIDYWSVDGFRETKTIVFFLENYEDGGKLIDCFGRFTQADLTIHTLESAIYLDD